MVKRLLAFFVAAGLLPVAFADRYASNLKGFTSICPSVVAQLDRSLSTVTDTALESEMRRLANLYSIPIDCTSGKPTFLSFFVGATNGSGSNGYTFKLVANVAAARDSTDPTTVFFLAGVWDVFYFGITSESNYRLDSFWLGKVRTAFDEIALDWKQSHP